jgi:hypothetical protein
MVEEEGREAGTEGRRVEGGRDEERGRESRKHKVTLSATRERVLGDRLEFSI